MSQATQSLAQMKKASHYTNRAFHKNGPKSYKQGQGALLKVLHRAGGQATSRELVEILGFDRGELKHVVRKAERNGYATLVNVDEKRTYLVKITDEGERIAEARCAANDKTADSILSCLSEDEVAQLNTITAKIIASCEELGAHEVRRHSGHRRCARRI